MLFEFGLFALLRINRHCWINLTALIDSKKNCAIKAMMSTQDLRHHWHRLLAAIFLLSGDQHNVLARTRTITTGISEPLNMFICWIGVLRDGLSRHTHTQGENEKREEDFHQAITSITVERSSSGGECQTRFNPTFTRPLLSFSASELHLVSRHPRHLVQRFADPMHPIWPAVLSPCQASPQKDLCPRGCHRRGYKAGLA